MPAIGGDVDDFGYELKFEHRRGYLYAYVKGRKDSIQIDRSYIARIVDECGKSGCKRLLVEEDLGTQLSITDLYEVNSHIDPRDLAGVKIAFVDRHPSHREGNLFGQTVARNRGIWVKVCDSVEEGEAWLLGSSD